MVLLFFTTIMKQILVYAFFVWVWIVLWRIWFNSDVDLWEKVSAVWVTWQIQAIYKEQLVCTSVCNWFQDLVDYAWELTKDMEFILTITQESKWDWKAIGAWGEQGLCQWTDTWKDFKNSREFQNPYRQIDKCWEQFQQWRKDGVIGFQLKWYNNKEKRAPYFELKTVFVWVEYPK